MNIVSSFVADAEPTKLMQPRDGSLDDPAIDTQATAMRAKAAGQPWLNMAGLQLSPMRIGIVASITIHPLGTTAGAAAFAFERRDGFHQGHQLRDIVRIRTGQDHGQWNALRIRNEVVFAARFRLIGGVPACFFPRPTARTELLSTTARDQSIWSAPWSRSKSR